MSGPFVARALGPDGRGQTAALLTAAFLAATLANLGVTAALSGRASVFGIAALTAATKSFRPTIVALSFLIFPVLTFVAQAVDVRPISLLLTVSIPAVLGNYSVGVRIGILTAAGRYRRAFVARTLGASALILSLVVVSFIGSTVIVIVGIYLTASIIPGLIPLPSDGDPAQRREVSEARMMLRHDSPALTLQSVLNASNVKADQAILPLALSNRDLGFYSVAATYSTLTGPLNAAMAVMIMRRMGRNRQTTTEFPWQAVVALLAASLLLAANAVWVIPLLFGAAFEDAVIPALILCGATVLTGLSTIMAGMLIAAGRANKIVVGEVLTLALLPFTVPISSAYGPTGAAGAAAISYVANFVFLVYTLISSRTIHRKVKSRVPGSGGDSCE